MSEPMRCPVCGALRSGDGTCETCGPAADPASSDRPTDVVMQQEVPTHELPSAEPAGRVEREDAARFVGILVAERYRVMGIVGRGGFGLVLRAMDQRLGRLVALKLLDRVQGAPREEMARFEREARILASLDHPGIVPVYDVGVDDGRPYIAMKLVRGPSLARKLQGGPLPIAEAVKVMRDVSAALGHAHARGVLHRDVKPSNILVERDGRFILADFGISTAAFLPRITMRGTLEGTLDYLAPEVVAGQSSEQSDLYSLGAVLHEMLLGRPCFQASDLKELLGKIVNDPPPLLREPTVPLPSPLLDLLSRLLSKEPNARPASAAALGAEAARLLEPEAPGPAAADAADRPADLATELERVELAVEAFATLSTQRRPDEDAVLTRASEIEVRASALSLRLLAAPRDEASRAFLVSLAHLADQVVNHLEDLSGRTPPLLGYRMRLQKSILAPIQNVLALEESRAGEDFFAATPETEGEALQPDWIDGLLSHSELKRHEAVLTVAGAGQQSFLAHLADRPERDRDRLLEALWRSADVLLLEGRGQARPVLERAVELAGDPSLRGRWQEIHRLFRREEGRYLDVSEARRILDRHEEASRRVLAKSFLFHPSADYRALAMELVEPPDYWPIVSHTDTPIPWILEIWRKLKPRVSIGHQKVFFACIRDSLRATGGPDRTLAIVEMLKELYQVDAFHESSYFDMLMDLDERVRAAGREHHLLIDIDRPYVERFRQFLAHGPRLENPIEGWTKVPLPIQRLLARRGYFLKHFCSHPVDPIALECLRHLRSLENLTPYLAIYSINARLLVELAKDQRLFRGEEPRVALVSNPKAPAYVVLKYISLLRKDNLHKIAASRECNQIARGYAVKILGRSETKSP